ncbi:porin family protein [Flavobacterium turcicum]|uniref:PorT family protein n=1 Tax=Flavobacterium turcicum TaxID=2764718 RepID=A0ABR7JHA4_9FLAO|nr:porin family protein [Flavobacterium turcicum]MBC5863878.1 PorT family protein [Flavobacterium turcicum]NHL02174.1 PorT family protein [Flavobacterium turcicum]
MRFTILGFLLLSFCKLYSQAEGVAQDSLVVKVDSLYREDQFYFSLTYNTLSKKPNGVSQSKFSSGISFGFLRDMPISKNRQVAVATGLGFTYNNYNQNLAVSGSAQNPSYEVIGANTAFDKNKISTLTIDVPLEFRWRTSTYESHKFWRIYSGLKFSYLLVDNAIFDGAAGKTKISGNKDFNKLQYGAYLSAGYNTINLYVYYGLNPLLEARTTTAESFALQALNFGVIFYIL